MGTCHAKTQNKTAVKYKFTQEQFMKSRQSFTLKSINESTLFQKREKTRMRKTLSKNSPQLTQSKSFVSSATTSNTATKFPSLSSISSNSSVEERVKKYQCGAISMKPKSTLDSIPTMQEVNN